VIKSCRCKLNRAKRNSIIHRLPSNVHHRLPQKKPGSNFRNFPALFPHCPAPFPLPRLDLFRKIAGWPGSRATREQVPPGQEAGPGSRFWSYSFMTGKYCTGAPQLCCGIVAGRPGQRQAPARTRGPARADSNKGVVLLTRRDRGLLRLRRSDNELSEPPPKNQPRPPRPPCPGAPQLCCGITATLNKR